jgi:hypothetical protein
MKTIQIIPCSYEKFGKIRDLIFTYIPFGITFIGYSKNLEMAIFNFWDSAYIPEKLKQFEKPFNKDLMKVFNKRVDETL